MTKEDKIARITYIVESFNTLRIKGIVKTQGDFASLLGISERSLSAAKNGNEGYLTDNLIEKVKSLMNEHVKDDENKGLSIPILPIEAMAGTLGEFAESVHAYDCERLVSPIKGADYAIKVCGDSMSPEIPNGSQILIKKIYEDEFVEWGKIFCLDTRNGAVIKKIFPTDNPEVVECRSVNPEFPPFKVNVKSINGWYRVLMVLSMK